MEIFNIIFEFLIHQNYKNISFYNNDHKETNNLKIDGIKSKLKMILILLLIIKAL